MSLFCEKNLRALIFTILFAFINFAYANPIIPVTASQPIFTPEAPHLNAHGYVLMDATTGKILAAKELDTRMSPASLTKLMSSYVISNALKSGSIHLDDKVRVSNKAWKVEGSRMFVKVNSEVTVKDLMQGIAVASGNDATIAMAEYIAGTEEAFTTMMNTEASLLGMNNSHFLDSTGLPNPNHYTTPHDLAILAQAYIKNFPEDYPIFSQKWFTYNGIRQPNRNRLLWRYPYADGLKTGHTDTAGYCLIASAKKDNMRLISVIMGEPNDEARTEDSIRLLTYGYRFFETNKLYEANKPLLQAHIPQGQKPETSFGLTEDLYLTVPAGQFKKLQTSITLNSPHKAPIFKGQRYGTLNISLNNELIDSKPLYALEDNPEGGFWQRTTDSIQSSIHQIFSKSDDKVNTG